MKRLYCPMCEREVEEGELIYEFLPPMNHEFDFGNEAKFYFKDCLIRFSHMECGAVLETGKEAE